MPLHFILVTKYLTSSLSCCLACFDPERSRIPISTTPFLTIHCKLYLSLKVQAYQEELENLPSSILKQKHLHTTKRLEDLGMGSVLPQAKKKDF